ncbi:MAG: hypothetical protein AB7S96_00745 [Candidatus Izemoplasmatales bacterium]
MEKIPELLNTFSHVEKSLTRNTQTGQNEVSLVFRKKYDDGTVKMVALRVIKGNILSFKMPIQIKNATDQKLLPLTVVESSHPKSSTSYSLRWFYEELRTLSEEPL